MTQTELSASGAYSGYQTRIMLVRERPEAKVKLSCSEDAAEFVGGRLRSADREILLTISLDARNTVVGVEETSIGTTTGALVSGKEVFKSAMLHNAQGVIVVHNHPSTLVSPSPQDIEIGKKLKNAGELLDIRLMDFIIVGDKEHYSFMDEGVLGQLNLAASA